MNLNGFFFSVLSCVSVLGFDIIMEINLRTDLLSFLQPPVHLARFIVF